MPISIDTYRTDVLKEAINAGADLVNDIWGLKHDKNMAEIVAESGLPICLMHNRKDTNYKNFFDEVKKDINESINISLKHNIHKNKIIIDPGIGFAKNTNQNLEIFAKIGELNKLGYPLLLGTSRKSVIGNVLNIPIEERLTGTIVLNMIGYLNKTAIIRVHDVKEHRQMLKLLEEISKFV